MRRLPIILVLLALLAPPARAGNPSLPEFTHTAARDWINSKPLTVADLRGRVALVHVWAFECWNCYRSFPWLNALEARLGDGLAVIGVHSPEFDEERDRDKVRRKTAEFGLDHPVMVDNDHSYWNALANRYWPAWYLVDRQGRLRGRFVGEIHAGDAQARAIEGRLRELLAAGPSG